MSVQQIILNPPLLILFIFIWEGGECQNLHCFGFWVCWEEGECVLILWLWGGNVFLSLWEWFHTAAGMWGLKSHAVVVAVHDFHLGLSTEVSSVTSHWEKLILEAWQSNVGLERRWGCIGYLEERNATWMEECPTSLNTNCFVKEILPSAASIRVTVYLSAYMTGCLSDGGEWEHCPWALYHFALCDWMNFHWHSAVHGGVRLGPQTKSMLLPRWVTP